MTKERYGSETRVILQLNFGRWFFQFGKELKVYYDFKSLINAITKTLKRKVVK